MEMNDSSKYRMDPVDCAIANLSNETANGRDQPDSTKYPLSDPVGLPENGCQVREVELMEEIAGLRKQLEMLSDELTTHKEIKQKLRSILKGVSNILGVHQQYDREPDVALFAYESKISESLCKIWHQREERIKDLRKKLEDSEEEKSELKKMYETEHHDNKILKELYTEVDSEFDRSQKAIALHEDDVKERKERRRQKFLQIGQGSLLND